MKKFHIALSNQILSHNFEINQVSGMFSISYTSCQMVAAS